MPKSRTPDYWDVRVTTKSPTRLDRDELVQVPCHPEEERPGLPAKEASYRQGRPQTRCSKAGFCAGFPTQHQGWGVLGVLEMVRGPSCEVVTDKAAPRPNARRRVLEQEQKTLLEMSEGLAASGGLLRVAKSSTSDEASICGFSTPMSQGWVCGDTRVIASVGKF